MEVGQVALDSPVQIEAVLVERGRGGLPVCWSNVLMPKGWVAGVDDQWGSGTDGWIGEAREGTVATAAGDDRDGAVSVECGGTGWDRADILCGLYFIIRLSSYSACAQWKRECGYC